MIREVIALGAKGCQRKQTSARFLSEAIREVQKGNRFFSPGIARRLPSHAEQTACAGESGHRPADRLSSREVEVLQLIAEGQANKQIAPELGSSVKPVAKHRQRIMQKLQIHDTASLTRYALAKGIIESSVQLTIV